MSQRRKPRKPVDAQQRLQSRQLLWLLALLMSCAAADDLELRALWSIEHTFEEPESAAIDRQRNAIYVSNVNGYALDGNGYISRVSLDGQVTDHQWITGLNSPTGVAIHGQHLWFADVTHLVQADLDSGEIVAYHRAPDPSPVLNDVAVAASGEVFVSGSASRTIYHLRDGALRAWHHDAELLEFANGLLVHGDQLIFGGLHFAIFERATGALQFRGVPGNAALRDFDGITSAPGGGFLVTTIDDDRVWHLAETGSRPVSDAINGIDINREGSLLAVPRVGGGLSLYEVISKP